MQGWGSMDLSDLKELQRAAKKLKKSSTLIGLLFDQPEGLPMEE